MNKIKKFIHFFAPLCCEKNMAFAPLRFFVTGLFCVAIAGNVYAIFYGPTMELAAILGALEGFTAGLCWVYSHNKRKRKKDEFLENDMKIGSIANDI